ncbi:MAG: hypothetical protein LWX52_08990 [Deltaproteobacteria bacterium]|nr:hypothetical protein [Deltaproteobacteria bacterium]
MKYKLLIERAAQKGLSKISHREQDRIIAAIQNPKKSSIPCRVLILWACAKTTYHFGISASGGLWPILIRKALEVACYSCGFAQSDRPNFTQI